MVLPSESFVPFASFVYHSIDNAVMLEKLMKKFHFIETFNSFDSKVLSNKSDSRNIPFTIFDIKIFINRVHVFDRNFFPSGFGESVLLCFGTFCGD